MLVRANMNSALFIGFDNLNFEAAMISELMLVRAEHELWIVDNLNYELGESLLANQYSQDWN